MPHHQYKWTVGWNRPGHAPEEEVREYPDLRTALDSWLNIIQADLDTDPWLPSELRNYWRGWLATQRAVLDARLGYEEKVINLEGDAVYVGRNMIWIALL